MMKSNALFLSVLLISIPVHAQTFYRCGKVYQSSPCNDEEGYKTDIPANHSDKKGVETREAHPLVKITEIIKKGNAVLLREANADDAAPCIDVIKKTHHFKDVESVRFEQPIAGEKGYFEFDNGSRAMTFYLNAKNSYGAYAGPQKYQCGISADGEIYVYP